MLFAKEYRVSLQDFFNHDILINFIERLSRYSGNQCHQEAPGQKQGNQQFVSHRIHPKSHRVKITSMNG